MISRTSTGMAAVLVLVLHVPAQGLCYAQDAAGSTLAEERERQKEIYRSRGRDVPRGYVIDRTLEAYARILTTGFDRSLANLSPRDRWLDIGAGQGQAILDYYTPRYNALHPKGQKRRGSKASALAISIEDRRTPEWHKTVSRLEANEVQYLFGKRLREYSPGELGRFQLITDVMGGFTYAANLSRFMQNVLELLEPNGDFFTVLQDVEPGRGTSKPFYDGFPFLTEIENPDGSKLAVCSWMKRIACTEVRCESKEEWSPPLETYHVRKVCSDVRVPALALVHFEAGTPPERRYRIGDVSKKPAPKPAD